LRLGGGWGEMKVRVWGLVEAPQIEDFEGARASGAAERCDAFRRPRRGAPAMDQNLIS